MGSILARSAAAVAPRPAATRVVPIPLHPRRLRARGFNPAVPIARAAALATGARLDPALLQRSRDTASQTGLDRRARRRNVRDAFSVHPGIRAEPHERLRLVDDVVTTGATLEAAARALRNAGFRHVAAVCVARTPAER